MTIDRDLIDRIASLATTSPRPIGSMSMNEIASQLGLTRMTLYRRAGSREHIVAALDAIGIDARREPLVRERVVASTGELLRERSLADVTLEAVAERARCSLPAIYDQFGGRQGVLKATFEQHSPLPTVERLVAAGELSVESSLRDDVHTIYSAVFDQIADRWPVLRAFVAEVMRDPGSEVGALFRDWYIPQALETITPTLERHMARGSFRPLPPLLIAQEFVGPMLLHIASRELLRETFGVDPPDRDTTLDTLTDMFCRAVAADTSAVPSDTITSISEVDHDSPNTT